MAKLKMNRRVPNKNADLLKKIGLMGTKEHRLLVLVKTITVNGH